MAKPRLCQRCKSGDGHCVVSTCRKALNAYNAGRAEALAEIQALAKEHDICAAELNFDMHADGVTGELAARVALVLVKVLDIAEAPHA